MALHADFYADQSCCESVRILENEQVADRTYRVRFESTEIARRVTPGQFLMLRLEDFNDPLLGRPLALYDTVCDSDGKPCAIDVVYLVEGKLTSRLAGFTCGQKLNVWGPLGNGFNSEPTDHVIMVAGGIGQTPFLALGSEYLAKKSYGDGTRPTHQTDRVTLCYGARSASLLAGIDDFEKAGFDLRICTDDGSQGRAGLVTTLLEETLDETHGTSPKIFCCGPEPMMHAVAKIAERRDVPCQVSLETPMACGIGICFTCVAKVKDENGDWDYKRTCVEGPVFDSKVLIWD